MGQRRRTYVNERKRHRLPSTRAGTNLKCGADLGHVRVRERLLHGHALARVELQHARHEVQRPRVRPRELRPPVHRLHQEQQQCTLLFHVCSEEGLLVDAFMGVDYRGCGLQRSLQDTGDLAGLDRCCPATALESGSRAGRTPGLLQISLANR